MLLPVRRTLCIYPETSPIPQDYQEEQNKEIPGNPFGGVLGAGQQTLQGVWALDGPVEAAGLYLQSQLPGLL